MGAKARIALTVGLGIFMGFEAWNPWPPSSGFEEFIRWSIPGGIAVGIFVIVPLAVGRWWVVAALAGPLIAQVVMQMTGREVLQFESVGPPLNWITFAWMMFLALLMLGLVAIRKGVDRWRERRLVAPS